MKSNIRQKIASFLLPFLVCLTVESYGADRGQIIRKAILDNGFVPSAEMFDDKDFELADVGKSLFESKHLSLNGQIACSTCHISSEGSSDGIPNAAGVRGFGESVARLRSGAKIVPRNTLALWGVGSKSHKTFFWDGKLIDEESGVISQFGTRPPSQDPLVTAVHLPAVEIRETLEEDAFVRANKNETVEGVQIVYAAILDNLIQNEIGVLEELAEILSVDVNTLSFLEVSRAIAAFIRSEFRIRRTKLELFTAGKLRFDATELKGAEIFYGKGGCALCHRGALFSDQDFHAVPVPPLGFGKNGFGADYGRFNASHAPADLYKFRTPILYNVTKTAPYGHAGSMQTLRQAIVSHIDPLSLVDLSEMDSFGRHEFSKTLAASDMVGMAQFINAREVDALITFLKTLEFEK